MNTQPVHFAHFNNHQHAGHTARSFTVAYRFLGTEGKDIEVAVAQCSKRDNFCKRDGRDVALQRLLVSDSMVMTPPRVDGKLYDFHNFVYSTIQGRLLDFTNRNGQKQKVRVW